MATVSANACSILWLMLRRFLFILRRHLGVPANPFPSQFAAVREDAQLLTSSGIVVFIAVSITRPPAHERSITMLYRSTFESEGSSSHRISIFPRLLYNNHCTRRLFLACRRFRLKYRRSIWRQFFQVFSCCSPFLGCWRVRSTNCFRRRLVARE
jgi:hypothetical protein